MNKIEQNITKKDSKLIQELLFKFSQQYNYTYKKITTDFNEILSSYKMKTINLSTIARWFTNKCVPNKNYYKYIIIFMQKYAPNLLKTENGSYLAKSYLPSPPPLKQPDKTYSAPQKSSRINSNTRISFQEMFSKTSSQTYPIKSSYQKVMPMIPLVPIEYEFSEHLVKLFKSFSTISENCDKMESLYFLLKDFYISLLKENKDIYFTYNKIKYKFHFSSEFCQLLYDAIYLDTDNRMLLDKVNGYFLVLYNDLFFEYNANNITSDELLEEIYNIVNKPTPNQTVSAPNIRPKPITVEKNTTKYLGNAPLKKLLQECMRLNFNVDIINDYLHYYKIKLSTFE